MPSKPTLHVPKKSGAPMTPKGPNQSKPKFQASVGQPGNAAKLVAALKR
jgi:hypothetical protein